MRFTGFALDQFKKRVERHGVSLAILVSHTMSPTGAGDRLSVPAKERDIFVMVQYDDIIRHYRIILAVLIALSSVAWGATVRQMGGMDVGWMMRGMTMGRSFSVVKALVHVGLWGTMLFPEVAPVAEMFAGSDSAKTRATLSIAPTWVVVSGHAVLWTLIRDVGYVADLGVQSSVRPLSSLENLRRANYRWATHKAETGS